MCVEGEVVIHEEWFHKNLSHLLIQFIGLQSRYLRLTLYVCHFLLKKSASLLVHHSMHSVIYQVILIYQIKHFMVVWQHGVPFSGN